MTLQDRFLPSVNSASINSNSRLYVFDLQIHDLQLLITHLEYCVSFKMNKQQFTLLIAKKNQTQQCWSLYPKDAYVLVDGTYFKQYLLNIKEIIQKVWDLLIIKCDCVSYSTDSTEKQHTIITNTSTPDEEHAHRPYSLNFVLSKQKSVVDQLGVIRLILVRF